MTQQEKLESVENNFSRLKIILPSAQYSPLDAVLALTYAQDLSHAVYLLRKGDIDDPSGIRDNFKRLRTVISRAEKLFVGRTDDCIYNVLVASGGRFPLACKMLLNYTDQNIIFKGLGNDSTPRLMPGHEGTTSSIITISSPIPHQTPNRSRSNNPGLSPRFEKISKNCPSRSARNFLKSTVVSKCQCDVFCGDDCHNRHSATFCDETNCATWNDGCINSFISRVPEADDVVEKFLTERCGWGLRAKRAFLPEELIIQYTGEVLIEDERPSDAYTIKITLENKRTIYITGARKGSLARFINHSCVPNCTAQKLLWNRELCVVICAGPNGVAVEEELSFDYKAARGTFECLCKACV
ncbi:hypothetical protein B0J14DRAFT_178352 [Halenospora varia]|nr:hypothetical protein B0J14DRAFT_178352 [Halenospora varia]